MLRTTQRKRVPSTRYHPYTIVTTKSRKMYFYTDENGDGQNDFRQQRDEENNSLLFESTTSTSMVSSNSTSMLRKCGTAARFRDEDYEHQENFKEHKDFHHIDKFVRNSVRGRLSEAFPSSFKVLQDLNGSTRFKMTYDKPWTKC